MPLLFLLYYLFSKPVLRFPYNLSHLKLLLTLNFLFQTYLSKSSMLQTQHRAFPLKQYKMF